MIIYNITVLIEETIELEWLNYVQTEMIPTVLDTGFFKSGKLLQVTDSPNEGLTYCLQFSTDNISLFQSYQNLYAQQIEGAHQLAFPNQLVTFSSTMKLINEQ
jgi:hypothetical protein